MHTFAFLSAVVVSSAALVSAAPSPAELAPRACTTIRPDIISTIDSRQPTYPTPGGFVHLNRTGGPGSNTAKAGFTFSHVPAGATGCKLRFSLPAITTPNQYATGANVFNVYGVQTPVSYANTWNNPWVTTTQWSSFTVPEYTTGPTDTIFLSNTCSTVMSYAIELADWQYNAGNVQFYNTGGDRAPPDTGVSLVFNC